MQRVNDIRAKFGELYEKGEFVIDKTGVKCLELIGESFIADETSIFGTINQDYINREIAWYKSKSLNVNDIPGGAPTIWKQVATPDGFINSNYGWCIWSASNYNQYANVVRELSANPYSRRAEMIYTRPSIWYDYEAGGKSDFICTDAVSYFIRDESLCAHVKMRSNDSIFGYKNDSAWQSHVLADLAYDLQVETGDIIWTASSLHIYERHFPLVENWLKTGNISLT